MEFLVVLILAWLASPIVLGILLAKKSIELNRVRKLLEDAVEGKTVVSDKGAMTRPQKQTLPVVNSQDVYVKRPGEEKINAGQGAEEYEAFAPVNQQQEINEQQVASANQQQEINEQQVASVNQQQAINEQQVASAVKQKVATQPRTALQPKEKKQIPAGVWLFGIGILLVLTAGAIFATTTWAILPAFGKIAVLMLTVLVFYAGAFIAQKKLELKNTSITFYILGSTFMAVINIAAGYFGWYGDYYTSGGGGIEFVWSISALITSATLIFGYVIYKTKVLGIFGYFFLLLMVLLGADFGCEQEEAVAVCIGITLLLTQLYVWFVEEAKDLDIIGKSHDIMCYIYAASAFIIALAGDGKNAKSALLVLAVVTMVLAGMRMYLKLKKSENSINIIDVIVTGLAILTLGVGIRYLEYFYQRLEVSLVIFIVIYAALTVLRKKEIYNKGISVCTSVFAQVTILVTLFAQFFHDWSNGDYSLGIVLLVISAALYVLEHINGENRIAIVSATVFYWRLIYMVAGNWDVDNQNLVTIIELTIVVASVIAGRFIYKKIARNTDSGVLVDWVSICSFSVLFVMYLQQMDNDTAEFIVLLLWAVYVAGYYKRQNWIVDRIMLTTAIAWAAFVVGNQPFVEIGRNIIVEWWISISLVATALIGFVWRKYSKAYTIVWAIVTMICFSAEWVVIFSDSDNKTALIKMVIYLIGTAVLAAFSFIRKNRILTVEVGVLLVAFVFLAYGVDALALYVLSLVLGVGYFIYLHYEGMSVFNILPVAQLYVMLMAQDLNEQGWLLAFLATVICGYILSKVWPNGEHKELSDDYLSFAAFIPIIVIWDIGDDKWAFIGAMMLALYILSFYKRYCEDSNAMINKGILTAASVVIAIAWINQPFIEMSGLADKESLILAFMATCVFNMIVVYRHDTNEVWGWITFGVAVICILIQAQCAIADGEIVAALILGIVMLFTLIWAYMTKRKQWFMLSAITLIAQCIYASREFWTSIAWWVYLLVAGAALIAIAARSEYKKRLGIEETVGKNKHFMEGWRL